MTTRYPKIRFVDQTPKTIKRFKGKPNKRTVYPGTSRLRLVNKVTKPEVSPRDSLDSVCGSVATDPPQIISLDGGPMTAPGLDAEFDDLLSVMNLQIYGGPNLGSADPKATEPKPEEPEFDSHNEFRYVMHYCRCMSSFYTVRDPRWNSYAYVGSTMAERYAPLKLSILAWSALHIAIREGASTDMAYKYHERASKDIMNDSFFGEHGEDVLTTCYFLLQFDVMAGSRHVQEILREVWAGIRFDQVLHGQLPTKLCPYGYEVLVCLLHIDIRSGLFHGNVAYPDFLPSITAGRDRNVEYLRNAPVIDNMVITNLYRPSRQMLSQLFGKQYPHKFMLDDEYEEDVLVLWVRDMMMFGRLVRLRNWLENCVNPLDFNTSSIDKAITALQSDHEMFIASLQVHQEPHIRLIIFMTNALYQAMVIYYHRISHPADRTSPKCQKAAAEIIKMAIQIEKLRVPGTPGGLEWPFPLFLAGVETVDPVYQEWVLAELHKYEKEGWGKNMTKTRELCAEVIRMQNESGKRANISEVMEDVTGVFIL